MALAGHADGAGRRSRLRQYQAELLERMQAARSSAGARVAQLGVQCGGQRLLLDLTQTGEVLPLGALCPVPWTQPWYLGLANVRGSLTGVIDLGLYLGQGPTTRAAQARLVSFAARLGLPCALLAERVYGLRHAADMDNLGEQLRDAEGALWTALDLATVAQDARFYQVGL
ncbi:chemotaxis protein CheW [Massilia sp. TS11]|uniref:chemotaxis protein CheW n=1 Tax=Massilia sp. TS11 TaxID=2908003 RepID=UPI001EDAC4BB|nr:chemotaxis protein CheW [Massilia sp. TS11]MCG2583458.1 chemotaxis protein CheW [Massilia sp. TS11]